jgi:hypothetical protein
MKDCKSKSKITLIIKLFRNVRHILVLVAFVRLLFVEVSQVALFLELIGGAGVLSSLLNLDDVEE